MEQNVEAAELFRENFPSDVFLQKYLGNDLSITCNPHRAEIDTTLYVAVRRIFDGVMHCGPKYLLKKTEPNFTPIYVFKGGEVADWVDPALESRGLMTELSGKAFAELCDEFIKHFRAGAFHQRGWWQWKAAGRSIWIEVIPEKLVGGMTPRKSLKDLLKEFD